MSNRISSKSKSSNKVKSDSYSGLKTKSNSSEASKKPSIKTSSNVKLKSETTEPSKVVKSSSSFSRSSSKNTSKKDSKDLTLKKSNSSTVAVKNSVNATKSNSPLRSEKIKESSSSHKSNSKSRNEKHERASRSSLQKNDGNKTEQEQLKKSRSKEQSNEHSRKGESNEHSRKGQSKEHSRKGESNEHSRKGQSNERIRKEQSIENSRKEQSNENSRKGRANENKKGESNEQRKKGHSKEHNKKQQVYEQGKKDQSYKSTRKDQVNKNNAEEQDQSSHKTSRPNETKKSDSRSKDGKKKPSKHSPSSKPPDIQNMQKLPENKEHNDTEAEARLNNIEAAKISTKITKPPKKPVTESKIQQQNDDTDIAEVIDFKDVPLENDKKQTSDETVPHVDPSHNSLDTLESGISMTSPHDLSDGEVEESFSSRVVEVDEMDLNEEDPSPPSSSNQYLRSSSSRLRLDYPEEKKDFVEEVNEQEDIDYEEDFEDYESDFDDDDDEDESEKEEESMTDDDEESEEEEERIVENGEDQSAEPDPQMKAILSAIEAENNRPKFIPNQNKNKENNPSTEGVAQPIDSSLHKPNRPKTSKAYVNFARAKEKAKSNKASQKLKNRGQLLQEMIQLDSVFIDLFSQAPESYETYIAAFGSSNSTQVSVQTNEDALTEAVQTDPVNILEKWTQNPIHIPVNGESLPTPEDYLGVGGEWSSGDGGDSFAAYNAAISSDSGRLSKFLAASSQVVLMLLEEKTLENEDLSLNGSEDESLGFSKSGIALGLGLVSLLEGRPCNLVAFCPSDSSLLLTGHGAIDLNNNEAPATSAIEEASREDCEGEKEEAEETLEWLRSANGSLLCLWSVRQPSFPSRIFTCRSPPLVATFNPGRPRVVISGLNDGSLAAWDLRESSAHHPLSIVIAGSKWKLSPPSYITACGPENIIEGSAIVALETVKREEEEWDISNFSSFQVVSLSCSGQLTWWVLVQGEIQPIKTLDVDNPGISSELGAAPWSRIILSRAASISISQVLQSEDTLSGASLCYDLKLSGNDPNQLYVATANGNIVNCSRHNIKMHPSFFTPELEPGTTAVSISVCPHDPRYFLVGGADGLIRLHCSMSALPLTCWQASTNPAAIKRVEWSPSRPCVFYMLDVLGMLHIWDLSAGDIYPIISVNEGGLIGGRLTSFNIARPTHNDNKMLFAAFASDTGALNIRSISSRFLRSNEENYKSELERFECYVNII